MYDCKAKKEEELYERGALGEGRLDWFIISFSSKIDVSSYFLQ